MFVRTVTWKKTNPNAPYSPRYTDEAREVMQRYMTEGKLIYREHKDIDELTYQDVSIWDSKADYDAFWQEPELVAFRNNVIAPFREANKDQISATEQVEEI